MSAVNYFLICLWFQANLFPINDQLSLFKILWVKQTHTSLLFSDALWGWLLQRYS